MINCAKTYRLHIVQCKGDIEKKKAQVNHSDVFFSTEFDQFIQCMTLGKIQICHVKPKL